VEGRGPTATARAGLPAARRTRIRQALAVRKSDE
jgi:hypothetical protein